MAYLIWIGVFGAVGAICRHLVGLACLRLWGSHFAVATLLVNVVGCFLLGLLMHLIETDSLRIAPPMQAGLTVGLLGGLTTFSTFGYQTILHIESGQWTLAAINVLANVILGVLAAGGGLAVGRLMA